MKKKFLALVLTLAMVLSLAPVGALAAGETTNGDVIVKPAETQIYPDGVDSLNKTAVKAEGENTYEVTLEVKMHETTTTSINSQAAATVLVIDVSNSMNDPTCGKEEHTHTDSCYTTEKKCTREDNPGHWTDWGHKWSGTGCTHIPFEGWFYQIDPILSCTKEVHTHTSSCYPIAAAKEAANSFVDTYAGTVSGANRYLSIVVFGDKASVTLDWTDVSTSEGKASAESVINNLSVDGGTNLEQGLAKAKDQFKDSKVTSVSFKNVVALTDGAPTYYGAKPHGSGSSGSETINNKTAETAGKLKRVANLYTVCFGAENKKTYKGGPTVGKFLENSIATDSNHAYNADNASALNNVFKEISENITSGLSAGTVHDALPKGVTSTDADFTTDWDLSGEGGFTCKTSTNAETGRTDYTYTKTYTVTIDPDEIDSTLLYENVYYPLNGETTLKVNVDNEEQELNFQIPYGKVTFNTYSVTYKDGVNGAVFEDNTTNDLRKGATIPGFAGESSIEREGYTFSGWKWYQGETELTAKPDTMPAADLVAVAQWTAKTYTVTWKNGEATLETDTGVAYNSDPSYDSAAPTKEEDDRYTYEFAGWSTDKNAESGSQVSELPKVTENVTYYAVFTKTAKTYTVNINRHLMGADGIKVKDLQPQKASGKKDTLLSTLFTPNQTVTDDNKNYVYVPALTTVTQNDGTATPLDKNATLTAEKTVIDLYYYLDNWKDGDSKTPTEVDSATGGDGIPDCYQVLVNYKSGDTNRGSVGPLTMEVLTIKDATTNSPINKGTVKASGSTAEATGNRCYFSKWTTDASVDTSNEPAMLGKQTFTAEGGKTYTFTANFERSSGGGSGGSNRPKPPVVEIPDDVPTGLNGKDHYAYVVGYPDGMVYPQKNITRAEVATIFFRLLTDETREANMTKSNGYNDMKDGAWYTCAVSTLSKMGIIKGYEDGSFKPDASISRAEFAAIAARFDPDGDKTPATFSDVSSHWSKDEISIAANHGWIKGYEDGSFKPDQKITRAETMTLVNRVLKRLPETKDDLHKDMKTWPDNQNESAWFYLAVQEATNSHYQNLKKDGTHEKWESMRETRDWAALEK